jgi:hypothetical protein
LLDATRTTEEGKIRGSPLFWDLVTVTFVDVYSLAWVHWVYHGLAMRAAGGLRRLRIVLKPFLALTVEPLRCLEGVGNPVSRLGCSENLWFVGVRGERARVTHPPCIPGLIELLQESC